MDNQLVLAGFSHSEIAGSKVVCHLTDTYRRLPRLSSPLTAKASAVCAYSLDHITQNVCLTNPVKNQPANNLRAICVKNNNSPKIRLNSQILPRLIHYQ